MVSLTRSFRRAIAKAATLPPKEQDELAALMLEEIADARVWEELINDYRSDTMLSRLAAEAITEDEAGLTEPLDELLAESEDNTEQIGSHGDYDHLLEQG